MHKFNHLYGKCGNFMLLFCKGQHGLVRKCVLHVQLIFPHSTNQIFNLWRCRCSCRRRC